MAEWHTPHAAIQAPIEATQKGDPGYPDVSAMDRIRGGNIGATLEHLVGYDAGLYGYMWSEVFSHDMFQTR